MVLHCHSSFSYMMMLFKRISFKFVLFLYDSPKFWTILLNTVAGSMRMAHSMLFHLLCSVTAIANINWFCCCWQGFWRFPTALQAMFLATWHKDDSVFLRLRRGPSRPYERLSGPAWCLDLVRRRSKPKKKTTTKQNNKTTNKKLTNTPKQN